MNAEFWHGKRVLITGHTGFKGAWLSLWLRMLGSKLSGFSLPPPTIPSLFSLSGLNRDMHSITGDLRKPELIRKTVHDTEPEIIFHMAAQSLVRHAYTHPVANWESNVMGTVHLLDAIRHVPTARAVVIVTSDKCYAARDTAHAFREEDRLGGYDPYSSSKACTELVVASFRHAYFNADLARGSGVALATVRAGNVMGGGDWARDRLIPDVVRAVAAGERVRLRLPNAVRPWQHVLSPLYGYLLLAEELYNEGARFTGPWNFAPDACDHHTVRTLVERLLLLLGKTTDWKADTPSQHEAHRLMLDASKARSQLGWLPYWNFTNGLQRVAEWYRGYLTKQPVLPLTLRQIQAFMQDSTPAGMVGKAP